MQWDVDENPDPSPPCRVVDSTGKEWTRVVRVNTVTGDMTRVVSYLGGEVQHEVIRVPAPVVVTK